VTLLPWRRRPTPTDATLRIPAVRVGIVDVGANTLRLLVATHAADGRIDPLREERRQLGLGEEIVRTGGSIGAEKLEEAAAVARTHVRRARKLACEAVEILVTSPGRQAVNGAALVEAIDNATGIRPHILSTEEEGALAWHGAIAAAGALPETVAVCDVGGGSTQLVVGTLAGGPAWTRSIDVGSLRLTRRMFSSDPPNASELATARQVVANALAELAPPLPLSALATGGTARSLRRIVGAELGERELEAALRKLAKRSVREISADFGVDRPRARTLLAGTTILAGVQRLLGIPFEVAQGGLREGAALALLDEVAAATG
jgi:exopolyphosphatase/guanosine-5'-triphosphate,3'-diphosphate pyrophosphatase